MAYQFDLPHQGEGMIVVLKRPASAYGQAAFPLRALRQNAQYEITNLDSGEKKKSPRKRTDGKWDKSTPGESARFRRASLPPRILEFLESLEAVK